MAYTVMGYFTNEMNTTPFLVVGAEGEGLRKDIKVEHCTGSV